MKNTYLDNVDLKEAESVINAISSKYKLSYPCSSEMERLGPVFLCKNYFKGYRIMSLEQLDAACAYYSSLNLLKEDLIDEDNGMINKLFQDLEDCMVCNKLDGDPNYFDFDLVEVPIVISFRKWLKDKNFDVELNCGMCHWITCLIEAYHAG